MVFGFVQFLVAVRAFRQPPEQDQKLHALDGVNYARTDVPTLVRVWDFVALSTAFLATAILYGGVGMVLFVPAAVAYLLAAGLGRAMVQTRLAAQVDRTIDAEARRTSRSPRTLQWLSALGTK